MVSPAVVSLLEAFGAAGGATIITGFLTYRLSAKKQTAADPNGARTRLQDEVVWLRHQLEILQQK